MRRRGTDVLSQRKVRVFCALDATYFQQRPDKEKKRTKNNDGKDWSCQRKEVTL